MNILKLGDLIGMNVDDEDGTDTVWTPVVDLIVIGGETAYICEAPGRKPKRRKIPHSVLAAYPVRRIEARNDGKICLTDRKEEFAAAITRGDASNLEVFAGWEPDAFFVKNHDSGKEYRVTLANEDGNVVAECECRDFINRQRICKHITKAIMFGMFRNSGK